MTDSHDDALEPVTPKKNKGGRPRKGPNLEQMVKDLQDQLVVMQRAALAQQASNADRFEKVQQEATLRAVPEASPDLPPGSLVQVGVDSSGAPIFRKIRWTKPLIEATYPPVTFTPMADRTVGPHGILYRVEPGIPTTVPSIVKDLYDQVDRDNRAQADQYKRLSADEQAELTARAQDTPGVGHRSRLYRTGSGLNVHMAETTPETPAQ